MQTKLLIGAIALSIATFYMAPGMAQIFLGRGLINPSAIAPQHRRQSILDRFLPSPPPTPRRKSPCN